MGPGARRAALRSGARTSRGVAAGVPRGRGRGRGLGGARRLATGCRAGASPTKKAPPRKPPATIAIVGAGMAGLTAALTLQDAGVPATVYEAAGQVGGRVHSNATDYWKDGQVSEWCGELINTDHQTMLRLARRFGLRTLDLHAAQAPGSEDAFHVLGALYPVAEADREFQAVYPLLRRDLDAAGEETTHKTRTPAGIALDRMSIREWLEARVPGGASSRLGHLLDAAYALEYGAPTTDQSALNLVYLLGEQPPGGRLSLTGMSDERYRIAGGNDGLPRSIAAALPKGAIQLRWRLRALGARERWPCHPGFRDPRRAEERPRRPRDPGAAVCGPPWPRLRAGRLRPAEAARDRGARDGTQLEAPRAALEPLVAPAGRRAARHRRRGHRSRAARDLGVLAGTVRGRRASSSATGSTRRPAPWRLRCPGGTPAPTRT